MEKHQVFSSKIKYGGIFLFKDFYKFCYDYLKDDLEFAVLIENKYSEKISGDEKEIKIEWVGYIKRDDYFKFEIKAEFKILKMINVEVEQAGKKRKTNKGEIEIKMKGFVVRDYRGQYATQPVRRFMRNIYEKWIIPAKIEKIEDKLIEDCDEFLGQAKAFLDMEGKR